MEIAFSEYGDLEKDHNSDDGSEVIRSDLSTEDNFQKEIIPPVYVYPTSISVKNSDFSYKESILEDYLQTFITPSL